MSRTTSTISRVRRASLVAAILFFAPFTSVPAVESPLADLRGDYRRAREKIEAEHVAACQGLNRKYVQSLDKIISMATAGGELEALMAAKNEKERFAREQAVPASTETASLDLIHKAQAGYRKALSTEVARKNERMLRLLGQYTKRLDALKRRFVKESKIEKAVEVNRVLEQARTVLDDLQSEMLTPTSRADPTVATLPGRPRTGAHAENLEMLERSTANAEQRKKAIAYFTDNKVKNEAVKAICRRLASGPDADGEKAVRMAACGYLIQNYAEDVKTRQVCMDGLLGPNKDESRTVRGFMLDSLIATYPGGAETRTACLRLLTGEERDCQVIRGVALAHLSKTFPNNAETRDLCITLAAGSNRDSYNGIRWVALRHLTRKFPDDPKTLETCYAVFSVDGRDPVGRNRMTALRFLARFPKDPRLAPLCERLVAPATADDDEEVRQTAQAFLDDR